MNNYKKLLADPKWKAKRESIVNRDNGTCQICGSRMNLNVHHKWYLKNKNPWEYPEYMLVTLCENCHLKIHSSEFSFSYSDIFNYFRKWYYEAEINSAIINSEIEFYRDFTVNRSILDLLKNEHLSLIVNYYLDFTGFKTYIK